MCTEGQNDEKRFFNLAGWRGQYASTEELVGWTALETSSPNTHQIWGLALRPIISSAFWNRQSDIHTHFMLRIASCVEVRKDPGFELLSEAHFFSFFCVQHFKCAPGETVWKCVPLSLYLNDNAHPPHTHFSTTLSFSLCFRAKNTFALWYGQATHRMN